MTKYSNTVKLFIQTQQSVWYEAAGKGMTTMRQMKIIFWNHKDWAVSECETGDRMAAMDTSRLKVPNVCPAGVQQWGEQDRTGAQEPRCNYDKMNSTASCPINMLPWADIFLQRSAEYEVCGENIKGTTLPHLRIGWTRLNRVAEAH